MDQDWILLILRSNPAPRSSQNSLRSAIQRRFCPAIVCPRSPRFLSWSRQSPLVLLWPLCLDSGPQSVSHLIWVLLPGIAAESQVTLMAHGEHLSVYYSDLSISSNLSQVSPSVTEITYSHNRHHQDDQWPSWVSPSPSVSPSLTSNSPLMSPGWCHRSGPETLHIKVSPTWQLSAVECSPSVLWTHDNNITGFLFVIIMWVLSGGRCAGYFGPILSFVIWWSAEIIEDDLLCPIFCCLMLKCPRDILMREGPWLAALGLCLSHTIV